MNWIGLATYLLVVALLVVLVIDDIRLRTLAQRQEDRLNQAFMDQLVFLTKISELSQQKEDVAVEKTEGFLKFVSQSRDWAFEYIEDVQSSISSLKMAVENGSSTEEEMKKLFELLPENNKENNNE